MAAALVALGDEEHYNAAYEFKRFSVGTPEQNERLISVIEELLDANAIGPRENIAVNT